MQFFEESTQDVSTHKDTHTPTKNVANETTNRSAEPVTTPQPQSTFWFFSAGAAGIAATSTATPHVQSNTNALNDSAPTMAAPTKKTKKKKKQNPEGKGAL